MSIDRFDLEPESSTPKSTRSFSRGKGLAIEPIVFVEAIAGKTKLGEGTGFLLNGYPNVIVTARHILVLPSGTRADYIRILAQTKNGDRIRLTAQTFYCDPNHPMADIAAIRIASTHESELEASALGDGMTVVFPYGSAPSAAARASRSNDRILLKSRVFGYSSGSPILRATTDGSRPSEVVGVYKGDHVESGFVAWGYALDEPISRDCINDAAG